VFSYDSLMKVPSLADVEFRIGISIAMKVNSCIDAGWFRLNVPAETCQPEKYC